MWSPEGRKQNAHELRTIADKVLRYRQLCDRFAGYFQPESDNARQLRQLRGKLEDLRARCLDREKRLAKGVVKIGVVGLEKQGKSAFLSAWLKSEKLLPSEAERCTWSTTVVEPAEEGSYGASVTYYGEAEFKARIASYFDALEPGSVERWQGLNATEIARLKAEFKAREGFDVDDPDRAGKREQAALAELVEIAAGLGEIKAHLGKEPVALEAASIDDLAEKIRPFIALKDTRNGNRPYPGVRAVKMVTVMLPVRGAMPGVVLMDLPGIDAPSDKARRDTEEALTNEVDVTIFVKDVTRPSLVRNEIELLRTVQSADRSISLKDRIFVVLTKVDLFDRPDENGNWHWSLAAKNFHEQAVDRVFPYSKLWVHQGPNMAHPVAKQLMDFYGVTTPVTGLERLQEAVAHYLSTDVEALDRKVISTVTSEFAEIEAQLRGALVTVKDGLSDREFERRGEQRFDELFESIHAGEDPVGLLPEIRQRLSDFMDQEMSEPERVAPRRPRRRPHRADPRRPPRPPHPRRGRGQAPPDAQPRPDERDRRGDGDAQADARARRRQDRRHGGGLPQHRARERGEDAHRDVRQGVVRGRAARGPPAARQVADRAHRRPGSLRPRLRERGPLPEPGDGQGQRRLRGALPLLRPPDRRHPRRHRRRRPRHPRARDARPGAVLRHGHRRQGPGHRRSRAGRLRDDRPGPRQARPRARTSPKRPPRSAASPPPAPRCRWPPRACPASRR